MPRLFNFYFEYLRFQVLKLTLNGNFSGLIPEYPNEESYFQYLDKAFHMCVACGYKGKKADLRKHVQRVHMKWKSFACTICDKKFASEIDRRVHYKNVHKINLTIEEIAILKRMPEN